MCRVWGVGFGVKGLGRMGFRQLIVGSWTDSVGAIGVQAFGVWGLGVKGFWDYWV